MIARPIEESPNNIIWKNLSMTWWERYLRMFAVRSLITTLSLLCVVPVAFTGLLSQLSYLAITFPSPAWLHHLPHWFLATLQGVMPPCLLALIMIVVPILLQRLAREQGLHSRVTVELAIQEYYFGFLFLQVFLVISISSSVAAILNGLTHDLKSLATSMAQNLPKAGNYFTSYMLLQALSVSPATLLRVSRLLQLSIARFLNNTAREKWETNQEPEMRWGMFFPVYTNLALIGLIYSVISPFILIFNIITFSLFLSVQRYNILNVSRFNTDTGGLIYPKAINQLFTGLYAMELYLTGLIFLVRDDDSKVACVGQGVVMIVLICCTVTYQILLNQAFKPLVQNLPVMLDNVAIESILERKQTTQATIKPWIRIVQSHPEWLNDVVGRLSEEELLATKDAEDYEEDQVFHSALFMEFQHEALRAQQRTIWLPKDKLGIGENEIKQIHEIDRFISISNNNASMNDKGTVFYTGKPPG